MTSISGLSSNILQSYENFKSYKNELTTENMFQMLSIQMDGDGDTITKDQLDTFVQSADEGDIEISDKELNALKTMQENWSSIAGDDAESITYKDMEGTANNNLLLTAVTGGITVADSSDSLSSGIDDIDSYLIQSALNFSSEESSTPAASSLLQTLLSGNSDGNDDTNANLIAMLTNIIADYESASTVDVEA